MIWYIVNCLLHVHGRFNMCLCIVYIFVSLWIVWLFVQYVLIDCVVSSGHSLNYIHCIFAFSAIYHHCLHLLLAEIITQQNHQYSYFRKWKAPCVSLLPDMESFILVTQELYHWVTSPATRKWSFFLFYLWNIENNGLFPQNCIWSYYKPMAVKNHIHLIHWFICNNAQIFFL